MKPSSQHLRTLFTAFVAVLLCLTLAGCGAGVFITTGTGGTGSGTGGSGSGTGGSGTGGSTTFPGVAFTGKVLSGTQPIANSSVQLYAAGITGPGSAPTALLATPLSTDATGAFSIPAAYPCPASTSQLYIVASGGTVGAATAPNAAITLLTAIGTCGQLAASSQFTLNEVTTAASAWSFAQFLAPGAKLGTSATNAKGIANSVATLASLVNLATGVGPGAGFPAKASSPTPRINSLANLLNACSSSSSQAPCTQLFNSTTASGASAPANTLDAALSLVRHPGSNVADLFTQSAASSAFSPALASAPSDWTLLVTYTGGGMSYPSGLGVTSTGSVWVANFFNVASQFSPTGQPLFPVGITGFGLDNSYGLAVDPHDNAWIPNQESAGTINNGLGSVTVLNPAGQPLSGPDGYTSGGFDYPFPIAIDTDSTAWIVDYGNAHITRLSSSGQPLTGTGGLSSLQLRFPVAIALDSSHNAWVANQLGTTVTRVTPGGQFTSYDCCDTPSGIAIDQTGHVWLANFYADSISEVAADGTVVSSGYTDPTFDHPQGIAIDGAGNVWVANFRGLSVTELAGASSASPGQILSPPTGWAAGDVFQGYALAFDASGNLWVTDLGSNGLTELIGVAPPVKTPLIGPPQAP